MKEAIRIIESEHRSLSAVLHALKELTRLAQDGRLRPDFRGFRAMIRYIDEFPERFHHPKEDRYLFERVAARSVHGRELVRKLEAEHVRGAQLVRELERAMLLYEDRWPEGWSELSARVEEYARFHWDHMRTEEKELIPLAERTLVPEDWAIVDDGFAGNLDPIAGMQEKNFRELFTRLVNLAPAPVGLGEPWKQAG
jgi:hemerythrin-like domain-containing protein